MNKTGILSGFTSQQLYNISVENGVNMSWGQWSRRVGSILCLNIGKDIPQLLPGVNETLDFGFTIDMHDTTHYDNTGTITPFESPRHAFPLTAEGTTKHVSSLAYVDDATRFVAAPKSIFNAGEFFAIVQGYCNLLADLSLVIKMGRNVKKCLICLYNIPENVEIPEFHSIAWSYDSQGPIKGRLKLQLCGETSNLLTLYVIMLKKI